MLSKDFNCKFNSVLRNFKNVSLDTLLFLFKSYCQPEYGLSLWNPNIILSRHLFKCFETTYSNALKKILGVPVHSSSHITADICNHFLLKHHLAYLQACYIKRLLRSENLLIKICLPFLKYGYLCSAVEKHFYDAYNVAMWENDLDVLRARIEWIQKHEERRGICHYFGF